MVRETAEYEMDNDSPLPRRALFQKRSLPRNIGDLTGSDKGDLPNTKAKIQFEHDLEASLRAFEKELHQQRLERLRQVAERLKEDSWRYPDLDNLG